MFIKSRMARQGRLENDFRFANRSPVFSRTDLIGFNTLRRYQYIQTGPPQQGV